MATYFSTDFESYAVGTSPNWDQSLLDNGWDSSSFHNSQFVVASNAHSGSNAVQINSSGALQRTLAGGPFGSSITAEAWFKRDPGVGGGKLVSIQIGSTLGSSVFPVMIYQP